MYAILGASGKVGGAAARTLRGRDLPVRAIVREERKGRALAQIGCEVAVADICDLVSLKGALRGADRVLVICPMNPQAQDAQADHLQKIATIGATIELTKPRFVVAVSDYGAHHENGTGIARSFHLFERRLSSLSGTLTVLRSAEHMQNWHRFLRKAKSTGILPLFYRPGTRPVPLVSAADVGVNAAELLIDPRRESREVVHVEGPRRYSMHEVVEAMSGAMGVALQGLEIQLELWISALIQGGLSQSYARLVSDMYGAHNKGRIDVDPDFPTVRKGNTSLAEVFTSMFTHEEEKQRSGEAG